MGVESESGTESAADLFVQNTEVIADQFLA